MRLHIFWMLNQESGIININIVDVVVLIITIAEIFSGNVFLVKRVCVIALL